MAGIENIALVLLAAGEGRRFGPGKLMAELHGRPLAHHAALLLGAMSFARRIAITGPEDLEMEMLGYETIQLLEPDRPMSRSIAAGIDAARGDQPAGIMLALADMPFVTAGHIAKLIAAFDGSRVASRHDEIVTPPAIFGPDWYPKLMALTGDAGAKALLSGAPAVHAPLALLADIDTQEQLAAAGQRTVAR